ncbi:MAG: DUF4239 domain-containing protein [Proteobacteria bacterium]|nr:DUF4239 domain-containing protein [Pseudomonadota bacterium]
MDIGSILIFAMLVFTTVIVVIAIRAGRRLGYAAHLRMKDEKESQVSAISAAILGLLAFILAFTFGMVYERYETRKALVRDDAGAIRTAYARSDFLAEPDRDEARRLFQEYVDLRVAAVRSRDIDQVKESMTRSEQIQRRLWELAVVNARKDMNSDIGALYVESLNELIGLHWQRVAIGLQARIPLGIWAVLYLLVILSMLGVGYQAGVSGSAKKSWATPILAVSFSIVITLIASLDRPNSRFIRVPQQPLMDLQTSLAVDAEAH